MGLFDKFRSTRHASAGSTDNDAGAERDALRLIDEGNALEEEGRIAEALQRYDAALQCAPHLARAHLNRGNALLEMGDPERALEAYATAIAANPEYAAAHYNSGNAYARSGRSAEAVAAYRRAIALKPDFADAEVRLGSTLEDLGELEEAVASYRRALGIRPDYPEVHRNLGLALQAQGRTEDAVTSFRRAVELDPDFAAGHAALGKALLVIGQPHEAITTLRRAVEIDPGFADAHFNLGEMLHDTGQSHEAVASYRRYLEHRPNSVEAHNNLANALRDLCQFDEAIRTLRRALDIDSRIADVHYNLGNVLLAAGYLHDAATSFRRALAINPRYADAHCNLGSALYGVGLLHDARDSYRRAIELAPGYKMAHNNLGNALSDLGDGDAGMASFREALRIDPEYAAAQSNLLFGLNYRADQSAATMLDEARRYGDIVARKARPFTDWPNVPEPARRLRIGFVSGDLRSHAVGYFVEGVLAALASAAADQVELFAYSTHFVTDAFTERIKSSCNGWRSAVGLSDEGLARRIRDDQIDILIDLSGHTEHNRLSTFAWKPAPVQATWLGYFATTGVAAIDYLIADPWTLPASEEAHFTETIWRLPETRLCFTRPDIDVDVAPLPALRNGYVTFGSFNRLSKMNDAVVAVWSRVLDAVPGSRLLLKSAQFTESIVKDQASERFAARGIPASRLIMEGRDTLAGFLAAFQHMDIALDPFPFTGGSTSAHGLWMGVPFVTLAGDRFVSRQGVGLAMNAGLPDWVAADADDYVARAAAHAGDLPRLASLRAGLRPQLLSSPVFDSARFAAHFATALRGMWEIWCRRRSQVRSSA